MANPFIGRVWYTRYRNWRNLGHFPNRRYWFFRVGRGNSMGAKSIYAGLLGLNMMVGIKKRKR